MFAVSSGFCTGTSGGGGGGTTITPAYEPFVRTAAFSSGFAFSLAHVPIANSIVFAYEGQVLTPVTDYTLSGSTITMNFGDDPANYDGNIQFVIQYWY